MIELPETVLATAPQVDLTLKPWAEDDEKRTQASFAAWAHAPTR